MIVINVFSHVRSFLELMTMVHKRGNIGARATSNDKRIGSPSSLIEICTNMVLSSLVAGLIPPNLLYGGSRKAASEPTMSFHEITKSVSFQ